MWGGNGGWSTTNEVKQYAMTVEVGMRRVDTGTPGLDEVLRGGFISGQTAIVNGGPGTGKTTLALQFLAAAGGDALYIGFEEREGNSGGTRGASGSTSRACRCWT